MTSQQQPPACKLLHILPSDLLVNVLTYLRAFDLVSVHRTCRFFCNPQLVHEIVQHTAEHVYPSELTEGFDTPPVAGSSQVGPLYTYDNLKNMEMLVVARVLSRPEPATGGFYVSKSWCKAALRWLEVQQEQHESLSNKKPPKKKLSKKQQRIRNRRLSDASPPWPNVNSDLLCSHSNLQRCSNKASRARRKVLDKQAWKVLKRLYPDSKPLASVEGECLQCLVEAETKKKTQADLEERQKQERKKPLACPLVRGIYTRPSRGVPIQCLDQTGKCPLRPGRYNVLPRAWCYKWRRYLKTGEVECPYAPCASELLCDAHRLPLLPPHLESYLYGETCQLLGGSAEDATSPPAAAAAAAMPVVGMNPEEDTLQALRAAGLSEAEVASQRKAMMNLEQQRQQQQQHVAVSSPAPTNQQLDRENLVVVEIVTAEEWTALQTGWPKVHSNFGLGFEVDCTGGITWSTPPCRDCDPSGRVSRSDLCVRNRARIKRSAASRATTTLEY